MVGKIGQEIEEAYKVSEVAEIFSVSRHTIFKWLSIREPEGTVIPRSSWFRLPSGHIRIRESAILKLMGELNYDEPK